MTENNDHNRFFDVIELFLDNAFKFEPRLQKVEFRTTVVWWVGSTAITAILGLAIYIIQKKVL